MLITTDWTRQWLMNDHNVDVGSFQDLQHELSELPGYVARSKLQCLPIQRSSAAVNASALERGTAMMEAFIPESHALL